MRRWKPQLGIAEAVTAVLLIVALVGGVAAAVTLTSTLSGPPDRWPINLDLYLWLLMALTLLALAGGLAYRLVSAFTLAYEIDRNGLYIVWLGNRAVVPLDQIRSIDVGTREARLSWLTQLGLRIGWASGRMGDGRPLTLFAPRRIGRCLIVHTNDAAYALSPHDQDAFVQDLEQLRSLGTIKTFTSNMMPGRAFAYAFWNDRIVRAALLLAVLLNLALLAFLATRYPQLAADLPMQFDMSGQIVATRPKYQIFYMPLAALVLILLNAGAGIWIYGREQAGARLLQITSVLMQVLFAVASITIALGTVA